MKIQITIENVHGDIYTKSVLEVQTKLDPKRTLDSVHGLDDEGDEVTLAELLGGAAEWAAEG